MKFEPDIIFSWDISKNDIPTIAITKIEYDPRTKHLIGTVIDTISGETGGAISVNQTIMQYKLKSLLNQTTPIVLHEAKEN